MYRGLSAIFGKGEGAEKAAAVDSLMKRPASESKSTPATTCRARDISEAHQRYRLQLM